MGKKNKADTKNKQTKNPLKIEQSGAMRMGDFFMIIFRAMGGNYTCLLLFLSFSDPLVCITRKQLY